MAESAVSFLCNQLSIWLQQEGELLGGLKQEVQYIRDEMMQMKAFLRVADSKEENDPQLKEWVRQVREIAYDTEDVLDEYMLQCPPRDAIGLCGCIENVYYTIKNLKFSNRIASEIQTIKHRLENVSKTQQRYKDMGGVNDPASSSTLIKDTWYDGRGDALLLEEDDVVGIDKPKKKLIDWLSSMDFGVKVISVVGMGGLGKTTLVKKVYDDASLKSNFDHHVWITVSESFKVEHLLRNIIRQLAPPQGLEAMNDDEMKEYIYKFLQHKNYIIVLDDVWQIHVWEAMRYAFPKSKTCGCVVITTRYSNIGKAACSENNRYVYELEPLPKEESKMLFYKKAFQGNSCPLHLKEICERILKICAGLPLAIVVIGGLLATKNNKMEEWELFSRSLGDEFEGDNLKRMGKILSLSYYDLPYYLKSCFLYLSIFPEDNLVLVNEITQMWVAEGFVHPKQGKTVEEVAETYVRELLERSLIKLHQTSYDGSPSTFRIHDLIREYIISKSKEQNVAAIFTGRGEMLWTDKIRRLALHTPVNYTQEEYDNLKYIRSLLLLGFEDAAEFPQILEKVLANGCRLLKVLELESAPINTIPSKVFKCYLLKQLNLSNTAVQHIPKSIGNLQNLESLDLRQTYVTELPIEILKLRKLRHLHVCKSGSCLQGVNAPYEIGSCLLSLQTLCFINADEVGGIKIVREIGKLTQLRILRITKLKREDGNELCSSISKLIILRKLGIYSVDEDELMDLDYSLQSPNSTLPFLQTLLLRGRLEKVPQWINPNSLHGLTSLSLIWSRLKEDPLECLEDLPNLVRLSLEDAYEGEGLSFKAKGFQRLKELTMRNLRGMRWIRVEKGSMPLLEELSITDMKLMVEVPEGIEHLTNLQEVEFCDMSKEFLVNLEGQKSREGKDWKLSHVPKVIVAYKNIDGNYYMCPEFVQADS